MYSIADYASMMADPVRMNAYADALRRSVNAQSVVVDLGSGTGAFAMIAAQLGARKVYAIEPDDAIHLGKAIAVASGLADRVEFVQAASTEAVLPERGDVIVSDIRGVLPLFGRHIPSIADARTRLLATSGVLIPRCDRLRAAIVEAPEVYERHVAPWCERSYGLDLQPARDMLSNTWRKVRLPPEQILTDSQLLAVLDYRVLENPNLDVAATWTARRVGVGHGLCIWFDTELADDVAFSNAPGEPAAIYGQAFFPFAMPASLGDGESISVRIRADLTGDDYLWQWSVEAGEGPDRRRSRPVTQSTLHGVPLGIERLKKGASSHVPTLTTDGEIDCFVLSRMQAAAPLGDIARELLARFPAALRDWNDALGRVGELSRKYSRD
jgi:Arginine methyltransferase oligomerization subdomain/Ribosomal protein L11 methyltransferase (PrmA)